MPPLRTFLAGTIRFPCALGTLPSSLLARSQRLLRNPPTPSTSIPRRTLLQQPPKTPSSSVILAQARETVVDIAGPSLLETAAEHVSPAERGRQFLHYLAVQDPSYPTAAPSSDKRHVVFGNFGEFLHAYQVYLSRGCTCRANLEDATFGLDPAHGLMTAEEAVEHCRFELEHKIRCCTDSTGDVHSSSSATPGK